MPESTTAEIDLEKNHEMHSGNIHFEDTLPEKFSMTLPVRIMP
jgi:hypothetical protein